MNNIFRTIVRIVSKEDKKNENKFWKLYIFATQHH